MEATPPLTGQWVILNQVITVSTKVNHHGLLIVCFILIHAVYAAASRLAQQVSWPSC
jgi:hypothetical protein